MLHGVKTRRRDKHLNKQRRVHNPCILIQHQGASADAGTENGRRQERSARCRRQYKRLLVSQSTTLNPMLISISSSYHLRTTSTHRLLRKKAPCIGGAAQVDTHRSFKATHKINSLQPPSGNKARSAYRIYQAHHMSAPLAMGGETPPQCCVFCKILHTAITICNRRPISSVGVLECVRFRPAG
jgi:hypothetical protein